MKILIYILIVASLLSCSDKSETRNLNESEQIISDTTAYPITGMWSLCKLSSYGGSTHFDRCPNLFFDTAKGVGTYDGFPFIFSLKRENAINIDFGKSSKANHFFRQNRKYTYQFKVINDLLYFDLQDDKENKYHLTRPLSPQ